MTPYLLLYPAFDHSKTNTRMTDPKVVHPATQDRIDFRNHNLDRPADMLAENSPKLFKQRCSLLQLGRIVGPPLPLKTQYAPIFKTQECKALPLLQIHHLGLPPRLAQTVKTLIAVRCKSLDRQDHCTAF